jgi:hypothetical protein
MSTDQSTGGPGKFPTTTTTGTDDEERSDRRGTKVSDGA